MSELNGQRKRLKVISCDVLFREVCLCAAHSKNVTTLDFLLKGLHDNPDILRAEVQKKIDETDESQSDAIVLGYALCSRGTAGIRARGIPLIIPKAHDCITLFLGSNQKYMEYFNDHPGTYYYTSGWFERSGVKVVERKVQDGYGLGKKYEEYLKKYGEDNAKYLIEFENSWIENYSQVTFIDIDFVNFLNYNEEAKKIAAERKWKYDEVEGNIRLIKKLIDGEWDEEEFLVVPPGEEIIASYDEKILSCKQPV
jgi:thiol-disulfide isomerase/thioredoxin